MVSKLPPTPPEPEVPTNRPRLRHRWTFERLEDRILLASNPVVATPAELAGAQPITGTASGFIAPGVSDFFQVDATTDELLIAKAHANGAQTRLSLLDAQGDMLTQSNGLSTANPDDLIAQHVGQGTYYLEVTGTGGIGQFTLTTQESPSSEPGSAIALSNDSVGPVVSGDFNGDGRLGIAVGYKDFTPKTHSFIGGVAVLSAEVDGTFQAPHDYPVAGNVTSLAEGNVTSLAVGDFNGDGRLDIAAGYENTDPTTGITTNGVAVLLGDGDGTFQAPHDYVVSGGAVTSVAVGDFNGDGRLDIAAGYQTFDPKSNTHAGGVAVLMGDGDGTFQSPHDSVVSGGAVTSLSVGDFNGDGRLDVAAGYRTIGPNAIGQSGGVAVLLGDGDGTFRSPVNYSVVGDDVTSLAVGDFNGDGRLDITAGSQVYVPNTNSLVGGVAVLLGNGDGTFGNLHNFTVGGQVTSVAVGDFNGDGRLDVAAGYQELDQNTGNDIGGVAVLESEGNSVGGWTFQIPIDTTVAGGDVTSVSVGDFNGDGRLDVAAGSQVFVPQSDGFAGGVAVLPGDGDGTFRSPVAQPVGDDIVSLAAKDLNGDSRIDVVAGYDVIDPISNSPVGGGVAVLLGNGDGAFRSPVDYPVAGVVTSLAVGDFNGDGRLDIAVGYENLAPNTNSPVGGVAVMLGNGDGTFQNPHDDPVAGKVTSVAVGDFNGDGRLDVAVGYESLALKTKVPVGGGFAVLPGNGDGTFRSPVVQPVGEAVTSLAVGNFNGDGRLDIAAGYDVISPSTKMPFVGGVAVLLGVGDGTFQGLHDDPVAGKVTSVAVGDFNGDGRLDVAAGYENTNPTTGSTTGGVVVVLGNGDGTFQGLHVDPVGGNVTSLAVGDFNGDGRLDVAAGYLNFDTHTGNDNGGVAVLTGDGDGTFRGPGSYAIGKPVESLAVGDFNGDRRDDLAYLDPSTGNPTVLLNSKSYTLSSANTISTPSRNNPLLANLSGNSIDDLIVIDQSGEILWRRGIPGQPGSFEPPIVVNPGTPSRGIAIVFNGGRNLIASVDAVDDEVVLYALEKGIFVVIERLPTGSLPSQIITANLMRDGLEDLIVRNAGDGTASIYLGNPKGGFTKIPDLPIGLGASDLTVADLANEGRDELIVNNQANGDILVFPNIVPAFMGPPSPAQFFGDAIFGLHSIYQAGNGPYGLTTDTDGTIKITSQEGTAGVAVGTFTPGSTLGLAVINPGTNTLAILDGLGNGDLANARVFPTFAAGSIARAADLRGDGITDLVVLTSSGLDIYLGDGHGGFSKTPEKYDVGTDPTGLTIADLSSNGSLDLLVGNQYGDVLVLLGNGDGTFRPFQSAEGGIALAVADLNGNGQTDFIYADQGLNRVAIQYGNASPTVLAGPKQGLLAPGAVTLAYFTIDHVTLPYLIVANSGGNDVLVYPDIGNGQFGPALNGGKGFFTGDNPVSVTVAYLDTNDLPDLVVADKGSNDVAILLGEMQDGSLTFVPGPRLKAGLGPVSTVVETLPGNPYPDLLISDSQSNRVLLLQGLGQGFFNDQTPTVIPVGVDPGQLIVGDFTGRPGEFDLITVNPGSNSLSFVANFLDGGVAQTIFSGGSEPVAAIEFSNNGVDGLLVANEGDGILALFLIGLDGLDSLQTTENPEVPNPTALAYDALSGNVLQFYVGTAGVEAAILLQFNLGDQGTAGGGGIASPPSSPPPMVQVARLETLGESSLAIVATLVTTTTELTSSESPEAREGEVTFAVAQGTTSALPNQPISSDVDKSSQEEDSGSGDPGGETTPALPDQGILSPLGRLLYRLDDAIERARQDARESTFASSRPMGSAERSVRALDAVLARWSPTLAAGGPSPALFGQLVRAGVVAARAIDSALRLPSTGRLTAPPNRPSSLIDSTSIELNNHDPAPALLAASTLTLAELARTLGPAGRQPRRTPVTTFRWRFKSFRNVPSIGLPVSTEEDNRRIQGIRKVGGLGAPGGPVRPPARI